MAFMMITGMVLIFVVSIPAFPFLFSSTLSSSPPSTKTRGFISPLIHRTSPQSPFYEPNTTPRDLMEASFRTSLARVLYLNHLLSGNISNSMNYYPISHIDFFNKDYVLKHSIGTPPMEIFVVPDTAGSNLIFLQCFPSKSSSYQPVLCDSPTCRNTPYARCNGAEETCFYRMEYLEDSISEGILATETLTVTDNVVSGSKTKTLKNMLFGCATASNNIDTTIPGVLSLTNHSSSLVGQMRFGQFSYCVLSNPSIGLEYIQFGSTSEEKNPTSIMKVSTGLQPNSRGWYAFSDIEGIYVNGEKVEGIPEWCFQMVEGGLGGFIIDTRTTYSHLHSLALELLIKKIKEKINGGKPEVDIGGEWDLCYDNKDMNNNVSIPQMKIWFKDNQEEALSLSNENVWVNNGRGQICFAIMKSDGISVLGMYQQRGMSVGFDLRINKVSFMYVNSCPKF